jgi:hypothetical protein
MEPKHTPTPWEVKGPLGGSIKTLSNPSHMTICGTDEIGHREVARIQFRRLGAHRGQAVRYDHTATDDANAALIVRAVNSFGPLVEACSKVARCLESYKGSDYAQAQWLAWLEAALKLAEDGQ